MTESRIEIREENYDAFCQRVTEAVRNDLDLTSDFRLHVGFPSSAFPLAPDRGGALETMTAISGEFITFASLLRKARQSKLLAKAQDLKNLSKLNLSPNDVEDTGEAYTFRVEPA